MDKDDDDGQEEKSSSVGGRLNRGPPSCGQANPNLRFDEKPGSEVVNSDSADEKRSVSSDTDPDGAKSSGDAESAPRDGSLPKKPKKDRSNLRKGKWTVSDAIFLLVVCLNCV